MSRNMLVVSDTSPISNLIVIGKLALLKKVFDEIVIPESVYVEIKALEKFNFDLTEFKNASWIKIVQIHDFNTYHELLKQVDKGEAEAITIAHEMKSDFLLIDEKKDVQLQRLWE